MIIKFIRNFVLGRQHKKCGDLNEWAKKDGFVIYNVRCEEESQHVLRHYYRSDLLAPVRDCNFDDLSVEVSQERAAGGLDNADSKCPLPLESRKWLYYDRIDRDNQIIAGYASHAQDPPRLADADFENRTVDSKPAIPHRLVFTHRFDLLNCTESSSPESDPQLHLLASNVKATVAAYSAIWTDLDVVFLSESLRSFVSHVISPERTRNYDTHI